jgi:hypothetical protein
MLFYIYTCPILDKLPGNRLLDLAFLTRWSRFIGPGVMSPTLLEAYLENIKLIRRGFFGEALQKKKNKAAIPSAFTGVLYMRENEIAHGGHVLCDLEVIRLEETRDPRQGR